MFTLVVTGSIATGKSTIIDMFAAEAIPVFSADIAVHDLYRGKAVPAVAKLVPAAFVNGVIDRKILSAELVKNPKILAPLEAIVHPMVQEKQRQFIEHNKRNNEKLVVLEIPLYFESKNPVSFDAVLVATCPPELQSERALARPGMTEEKLKAILNNQMPQQEKISRADYVINSSIGLDETRKSVKSIITSIITNEKPPERTNK